MHEPNHHEEAAVLIRKVAEGDRHSFEALYDQFSGLVFSTASRILSDQTDAEDVTQDVFVQIWDKAGLYSASRGTPVTWIITLTKNKSIDRLRSVQRKFRLKEEVQKENAIIDVRTDRKPENEVQLHENSQIIKNAVAELLPDQRTVIELAYFSGLTQSQIAEELNEPVGTVKARIRRAMGKLKELVSRRL
ncbi:MAG: sigma-70 family RNA polymerase sigma factor [Chthoniobacterales bacterium]